MKKIKIFSAILMVMITILANSMVAFAAPQTMPDGNTFDPEYYAEHNPDVVAVFGTDAKALYSHYINIGKNEGRLPYDGAVTVSTKVGKVSDALAQARYDVFHGRWSEYLTNDPSVFFDADYYLANYPELATTVGTNYKALYNHYMNYGRFEGRTARLGYYPERKGLNYWAYEDPNWINGRMIAKNSDLQYIEWLSSILNDSMSEREIATIIHDEIVNRVTYGYVCDDFNYDDYEIFEKFKNGTTQCVCEGYSTLFAKLCKMAGINCQKIVSWQMNHSWNRVMMDGIWYDVDVTWDDCGWGYKYFLIPAGTGVFAERTQYPQYINNDY